MEKGFTYFDTAYMYHAFQSEEFLREALVKRHPRNSFTVADKMPTMFLKKQEDLERIFQEQLVKCGVEYFDYYMLHNLGVSHYAIAQKFDAFAFIQQKKQQGLVREIGFSYHDNAHLLDEILTAHPEVDFVQLQINYLDWEDPGIQSRKCYETARRHGKKVIVMEPVKGGTLAKLPEQAQALLSSWAPNQSAASWAVRFAAGHEGVMAVLSGMSNLEQLTDNTSYMEEFIPLNDQEQNILRQAVDILRAAIAIPCTACGYCVDGCPKKNSDSPVFCTVQRGKTGAEQRFFHATGLLRQLHPNYGKSIRLYWVSAMRTAVSSAPGHHRIFKRCGGFI